MSLETHSYSVEMLCSLAQSAAERKQPMVPLPDGDVMVLNKVIEMALKMEPSNVLTWVTSLRTLGYLLLPGEPVPLNKLKGWQKVLEADWQHGLEMDSDHPRLWFEVGNTVLKPMLRGVESQQYELAGVPISCPVRRRVLRPLVTVYEPKYHIRVFGKHYTIVTCNYRCIQLAMKVVRQASHLDEALVVEYRHLAARAWLQISEKWDGEEPLVPGVAMEWNREQFVRKSMECADTGEGRLAVQRQCSVALFINAYPDRCYYTAEKKIRLWGSMSLVRCPRHEVAPALYGGFDATLSGIYGGMDTARTPPLDVLLP